MTGVKGKRVRFPHDLVTVNGEQGFMFRQPLVIFPYDFLASRKERTGKAKPQALIHESGNLPAE